MTWPTTLALGGAVGLGVAMPLGAIGVLLVQTGLTRGWRPAAAGGLGAATVDLAYATLAVLTGTAVSGALAGHERAVHLVGAAVLGTVAAAGIVGAWRARGRLTESPADGAEHPDGTELPADGTQRPADGTAPPTDGADLPATASHIYARFVVLTAVNPLTVVYFTAVAAGLGERLASTADRVAFVVGIGVASAAWQLALAAVGAGLRARVSPVVRTGLTLGGYGIVAAFAVVLALR